MALFSESRMQLAMSTHSSIKVNALGDSPALRGRHQTWAKPTGVLEWVQIHIQRGLIIWHEYFHSSTPIPRAVVLILEGPSFPDGGARGAFGMWYYWHVALVACTKLVLRVGHMAGIPWLQMHRAKHSVGAVSVTMLRSYGVRRFEARVSVLSLRTTIPFWSCL